MIKLHSDPLHRRRQIRWVLAPVVVAFAAMAAALLAFYHFSNQRVQASYFSAHVHITHTGQLLHQGMIWGFGLLALLSALIAIWRFRTTYHIVRPVHALHQALEALVDGNLAVRLELREHDEFHEIAAALNRLVEEFRGTLQRVHGLVDEVESQATEMARAHPDSEPARRLHALAQELDEAVAFFHTDAMRVVDEA